jgi:hypothetical protein
MNAPWSPEELDLLLSGYLDGELDLDARMDLEVWLLASPRAAADVLGALRPRAEVPPGWTVRAYKIGVPASLPAPRRMAYLGLGQALARPRVSGHRAGVRRRLRSRRIRVRL